MIFSVIFKMYKKAANFVFLNTFSIISRSSYEFQERYFLGSIKTWPVCDYVTASSTMLNVCEKSLST